MADHTAVESVASAELIEEDKEEEEDEEVEDIEDGSSTEDLAPKQVPVPHATVPAVLSDEVAGRGLATSLRAQWKVPTMQAELISSAKTDDAH